MSECKFQVGQRWASRDGVCNEIVAVVLMHPITGVQIPYPVVTMS